MTDYISRDGFVKWVEETYCKPCEERKQDYNHCRCGSCQYDDMMRDVDCFPAADVRPVVRGEWLKSPECPEEYDICSVCGLNDKHRSRGNAEHPALESIPPFCKWCGADMRKEIENVSDDYGHENA